MQESRNPKLEILREQVDTLAIRLVLEETTVDQVAKDLAQLEQAAEELERPEIGSIAGRLKEVVESSADASIQALAILLQPDLEDIQRKLADDGKSAPAQPANVMAEDLELLTDFIVESQEHLTAIETQVLALERDEAHSDAINAIFRGFHTIKGLAGFLEQYAVRDVAHEVETVLDLARKEQIEVDSEVIDLVLEGADFLKKVISELEEGIRTGQIQPAEADEKLLARIRTVLAAREGRAKGDAPARPAAQEAAPAEAPKQAASTENALTPADPPKAPTVAAPAANGDSAGGPKAARQNGAAAGETHTVKIDTAKLDYLVDMVGEAVIAQAMVFHDPALVGVHSPRLTRNLSQLARITSEVQKTAMAMRMLPIGRLFQRMSRVVRDLSRKSGKQVDLVIIGEDTELDRTLVDELADPLMHMVRNAVDHGIEDPADRMKAGKPASGTLTLKASHEAGQICIEISDDGKGLNQEKILKKARERGLISPDTHLNESEIFALIFEPGFSTADKVTDISGRGVGMDVVRKQIQKLRGRVEIQSTPGLGTSFLVKLPLTLAIINGLLVKVGHERYVVPLFAVREMLRPTADMVSTVQGRDEMVQVRGRLLPLVRLHRKFGVTPRSENPTECLLIVAEHNAQPFCLMVDELIGKQEVVIKSLGESLKNIRGVAGGAILGDGRVGLILDLDGIFGGGPAA